MISSQEAFLLKLKEAILDELYSASCFETLAKHLPESYRFAFLTYAEDEKRHAEILKEIYQNLTNESFQALVPKVDEIDDVLMFLITYKSEEEAGIFLYESLYRFSTNEREKEVFKMIKEEEENHLKTITKLISIYKERAIL